VSDDASKDAEVGKLTRELLAALSEFADMLAIDAPEGMLANQLQELERVARQIDAMTESGIFAEDRIAAVTSGENLLKLWTLLEKKRAESPEP
jgi:fructoselysine-6-P-deglycase FrlB-like protein